MSDSRIVPSTVTQAVEQYVDDELAQAVKYTNREPLDESGVYSLHSLAAVVYAAGWADGERAEAIRGRSRRQRAAIPPNPEGQAQR